MRTKVERGSGVLKFFQGSPVVRHEAIIQDRVVQPVLTKFRPFREAEAASRNYYQERSLAERLEALFQLRAMARSTFRILAESVQLEVFRA
jgi:hypothetical protein